MTNFHFMMFMTAQEKFAEITMNKPIFSGISSVSV